MSIRSNSLIGMIFCSRTVFMISFLCFEATKLISSGLYSESKMATVLRLIELIFYSLLSFFAYRNYKVAIWTIAFVILFSGASTMVGGVLVSLKAPGQLGLKVFAVLVGLYFTYAGVQMLFLRSRPAQRSLHEGRDSDK